MLTHAAPLSHIGPLINFQSNPIIGLSQAIINRNLVLTDNDSHEATSSSLRYHVVIVLFFFAPGSLKVKHVWI